MTTATPTLVHGFEKVREEEIPELKSNVVTWRHAKTGARLLCVENEDENKVFGINFKTPPEDSTGIAHIMEHSVLCGSRKFPVKDPFVQLIKGSLNTFLNAMTFSDKTSYPVASVNRQDFYNLVDVYLDAVFFPRISEDVLQQEGWHYELESPEGPMSYKGVVFNEMKGAFSSPDGLVYRWSEQSLFPDSTYGVESGGDPVDIPDLTYDNFKKFHEELYHPSNAYIWFYGDDHTDDRLQVLDEYLNQFEARDVNAPIVPPTPITEPRTVEQPYPASEGETKHFVTVSWKLADTTDPELSIAYSVLEEILIGNPASPLHKALIDSGLGEDITGAGLDAEILHTYFSIGLKGVAAENIKAVEDAVVNALQELADNGIDDGAVDAALNTIEFKLRENNTGRFPQGLMLMIQALRSWLYDGDPLTHLRFETPLGEVKSRIEAGGYFENLIRKWFLDNNHRVTLVLKPDPGMEARLDEEEKARLAEKLSTMTDEEKQGVIDTAERLHEIQSTPDTAEDLATLPVLELSDIPREASVIPIAASTSGSTDVLYHDLFTNGIVYTDLAFDLHNVPAELVPFLTLFNRALLETGAGDHDFVKLQQWIGQKTGGIRASHQSFWRHGDAEGRAWQIVRGKATTAQVGDLLDIVSTVLTSARFDNKERIKQLLSDIKAGLEAGLVPAGTRTAALRLYSSMSESGWLEEQTGGVEQIFFLRDLIERFDEVWPTIQSSLEQLRDVLVRRNALTLNVTTDGETWNNVQGTFDSFLGTLPEGELTRAAWKVADRLDREALTIPAQVNYVGKAANLYDLGYTRHGSAEVIGKLLRTNYLWEKIRVQGGAYGGFCSWGRHSGSFTWLSYRDPNLLESLEVYDRTADYIRNSNISDEELRKAVIGAIGDFDAYQLPDAKGFTSMIRHLIGESDESRQAYRTEILETSADDFSSFADALAKAAENGHVVVVGNGERVESVDAGFEITKVL